MHVLIIEDETPAAERLQTLLSEADPALRTLAVLDSVESSVEWLDSHPRPDLLFCDIQLADGLSFEIFAQREVQAPVIFTTAYDEYALRAFQVNSIDYLLKPVEADQLRRALDKYRRLQPQALPDLKRLLEQLHRPPAYRERFLIRLGEQFRYVLTEEIAYFMAESGVVYAVTREQKRLPVDHKVEELEQLLDPRRFFRINRKFIVSLSAIRRIHSWFNSRLKLELEPAAEGETVVSRERVNEFKQWLNS
jgi:DNA-binding LytR/AlgR family response regulator